MAGTPRPSTLRTMTDAEVAWLAGLLEGEGSFLALRRKGKPGRTPRISMGSTDLDVLEGVQAITGVGAITPVSAASARLGTKPMWQWRLTRAADCKALAERLKPWMGSRRSGQIDVLLDAVSRMTIPDAGMCSRNLHALEGANLAPNGGRGTCRACLNERRRKA